ncbi:tryptophan aminotransferase-related protein 1-like [Cryptomeria japonica]|uniref:tryptophan aminotransferase-related protein 1-like n=1 Tax=Cryptomeria japonica TaxID=3369 RepID=UPI0027DA9763|nr:tryptophan aminotransferase-related protein 1-like [Cryptomeria japonica]
MKRRVSEPNQLELKGRLLGKRNATSRELDRPMGLPFLQKAAEGWSDFDERERTIVEAHRTFGCYGGAGSRSSSNPCVLEPRKLVRVSALVENIVAERRYIVLGTGSVQLINAAINSLSPTNASNLAKVAAVAPFCSGYKVQIEFVTSLNYPDTLLDEVVFKGKNVKMVYDHICKHFVLGL